MSDERLRAIERRTRAGDSPHEYVKEKVRVGLITAEQLVVCASLGSVTAMTVCARTGVQDHSTGFARSADLVASVHARMGNLGLAMLAVGAADRAGKNSRTEAAINDLRQWLAYRVPNRQAHRLRVLSHLPSLRRRGEEGIDNQQRLLVCEAMLAINSAGRRRKREHHVEAAISLASVILLRQSFRDVIDRIAAHAAEMWITL